MDQFRKSMETGGILKHMKASTDLLRPMFVNEKKALTAGIHNDSNTVDFRIVNLCINFLLQFSSRNFWGQNSQSGVQCPEANRRQPIYTSLIFWMNAKVGQMLRVCNIYHGLQCFMECWLPYRRKYILYTWGCPGVLFWHWHRAFSWFLSASFPGISTWPKHLPTASTCSLVLRIPTCYGPQQYADFKEAMLLGLFGNDGFGGVWAELYYTWLCILDSWTLVKATPNKFCLIAVVSRLSAHRRLTLGGQFRGGGCLPG